MFTVDNYHFKFGTLLRGADIGEHLITFRRSFIYYCRFRSSKMIEYTTTEGII